ncbi:hypothetical protein, partial [Candidatus Thiosymbion oneisti]|uniref:hypothetical protein n=1 Tax=Candidatus Thiosymbion oneisti TaxID=589554 RepID=UPI001C404564
HNVKGNTVEIDARAVWYVMGVAEIELGPFSFFIHHRGHREHRENTQKILCVLCALCGYFPLPGSRQAMRCRCRLAGGAQASRPQGKPFLSTDCADFRRLVGWVVESMLRAPA